MMRAPIWIRLAEPVHLLGEVGRVDVFQAGEGLEARPRALQVLDSDQDVDDRLRRESRHGGAADVVDAADGPAADRGVERGALPLEGVGPGGIVGFDPNHSTSGRSNHRSALRLPL